LGWRDPNAGLEESTVIANQTQRIDGRGHVGWISAMVIEAELPFMAVFRMIV
jgi:hypothetical protein